MLSAKAEVLKFLQDQVHKTEGAACPGNAEAVPTGAWDRLLPGRGFRRGTLVEWLGEEGGGATTLALIAARQACQEDRVLVVVDRTRRFYPPAAARLGIDLQRLMVVCPQNQRDYYWTLVQCLRCPAVTAVLSWPEKLGDKEFRRLQLAAEAGQSLGLLVRPNLVTGNPTWAETQLRVQALPPGDERCFRVEILRCRGAGAGKWLNVKLDEEGFLHETNTLPLASQLAAATSRPRAARA